ncbi:peptidoglycan-binding protein [Streptomyces sp. NPDC046197]|uniref:peptidoglycan-binding protein n=1 Tax=Streptomyces sp. NPDC046197 TaxID=3154337 RepID=UPI0033C9C4FC
MESPVFEEIEPEIDCDCPGCAHSRGPHPHSPAARTPSVRTPSVRTPSVRRTLVVAAVTAAALGAGHAAPAVATPLVSGRPAIPAGDDGGGAGDSPTPQGEAGPLRGSDGGATEPEGTPKALTITRTEIISRARAWVAARVPYDMYAYWSDGYRQDCSGFVSMAWNLPRNEWTGSLGTYAVRITKNQLQPGDILLYHNRDNPQSGSHVVIFGGWTDHTHRSYIAYEQTPRRARRLATPYAYWTHSSHYVPYRYKGIRSITAGARPAAPPPYLWTGTAANGLPGPETWPPPATGEGEDINTGAGRSASHGLPGYPGRAMFRPGANNEYVTQLGNRLVKNGYGRFYPSGPGPRWSLADRRAVEAFQRAQGWRGGAADGYPGPETWRRLFA